jgi:micrococcal nuclease
MRKYLCYLLILLAFGTQFVWGREAVQVFRVVDGDTLKILYHGEKTSVRLIGIDAPESHENAKLMRDSHGDRDLAEQILEQGRKATQFTACLVKPGDTVYLDFDQEHFDKYHRLLGYIYLKDGRFLNEEILKAGYAKPMTISPNTHFSNRFIQIYQAQTASQN